MRRSAAALLVGLALWLGTANGQQPGGDAPSVADEILVKFRPGASQARRDTALAARGSQVLRRFAALDLHHVRVRRGQSLQSAVASLQADPDVMFAQPNYTRRTTVVAPPDDPFWVNNTLWGLQRIQAQNAWSSFTTGDGSVVVAAIDTGVNYLHPDLAANMWTNPGEIPGNGIDDDSDGYVDDVHGINALTHSGNPMDDHGHGTHTAGTMAAVGNNGLGVVGVSWNAKIVACKFLNAAGNGSDAGAIECFNYIVMLRQRGVNIRVSNSSWGGTRGGFPEALNDAIDAAGTAGILNVCAAGNDNASNDTTPFDPASLPASSIVSVAASDQGDGRAWFSNYGASVHLAAPGVDITSTYLGNYGTLSGTSMAAPHASGVAALVAQLHPSYSPETIKAILIHTVDVLPQWSGLAASGGRLNAFRAASDAVANTPPSVTLTSPADGATFIAPATMTLTAAASDGDIAVTLVEFYANGSPIGSVTSSPYTITWPDVAVGTYVLTAVATDYLGATTTSTAVTVTVVPPATGGQTLFTTQVPTLGDYADGATYELGMRFVSDVAGQITAIRFWKTPTETGQHVGRIWTTGGALLASVTFTGETASGWQQQALATPLAIAAGTNYIVSVPTGSNGRLVATPNLLGPGLNNGLLHAPAGNSGRYAQPPGAFPAFMDSTAYFRDIVFVPNSSGPDTTPPSVSITQPTQGGQAAGVVTIAATASDDIGVAGVQFQVDGVNFGGEVTSAPYSVVWNSAAVSNGSHTLTAIARDAAGHTTPASVTVTVANVAGSSQTLFTTQVPALADYGDGSTYELGMRFVSDVPGQITAIRFWKTPTETGQHVGRIWTTGGAVLASVTFTAETASGWQQQAFTTPLAIAANTEYIVSVPTGSNGRLVATVNLLAPGLNNGPLHAPAGNSGRYGMVPNSFPGFADPTAYFRDIVFSPNSSGPDTTPPGVSITQPTQGGQVAGVVTIAAAATDDVGVAGVQFQIDGGNFGGEVTVAPYSVAWNSALVSNGSHTLTAIARDAAGHTTPASVTVTVANGAGPPSQTLFTTQVPALGDYADGATYELGMRFVSDVAGQITAIRFWKTPTEAGPHVGRIWTTGGTLLASASFTGETASGWQQQALTAPLAIAANTEYIVSVPTGSNGRLVATVNLLAPGLSNGPLHAPAGNSGRYGQPAGNFPANSDPHAYFRDVVFVPAGGSSPVLTPAPVQASNLTVRLDFVGQIPTHQNPTSPVVAGSQLLLVNQAGYVYRWDGTAHDLLTPSDFPAGIFPPGGESVLNVASNTAASSVFVMFSTFTAPAGIPVSVSPRPTDSWQVLYQYDFNGLALSNPRPIRAFQVRSDGHTGGGLVVLNDGNVVCAIGDNGDAGEDGGGYPQDPTNHLAKIVRINPADGSTTVLALGVRNAQRLTIDPNGGDPRLVFADLGGYVAEEINSVRLADLLGASSPLNFGWGRSGIDGNAREGTFYIDPTGAAVGAAPSPEAGFVQPIAQFGREGAAFIAVSGPVSGSPSFTTIRALFGDLPGGSVYATTGPMSQAGQAVFAVNLVDDSQQSVTLTGLAGGRPDPRFFVFSDGTAGVLLERTGAFYRLTEVLAVGDSSRRQ